MSNINTPTAAEFFGKDGMVPFIGVVEDVNDPKTSGRVKVRCVGWHPKDKEGGEEGSEDTLTTEDLPWARVGMPVTHAQQSRVGGKHGLLPGCWVIGFFLDGSEGQDPFVLSTFNFTSKASEQDYRALPEGQDGTFSSADKGFDKNEVSPKTQPNIDTRQPSEREQKGYSAGNDPSGDNVNDDSDNPCEGKAARSSVASIRRQKDKLKVGENGNSESQRYQTIQADGLCGSTAHAADDIQRRMAERMPSQYARIVYGDAVWNRFTGSHMDMGGIMRQLALEIGNLLKGPAQSQKAFLERTVNRLTKATVLKIPDRDGVQTKEADEADTVKGDLFHALFGETVIDVMTDLIFQILKVINEAANGQLGELGNIASTANTAITNFEAICITDTLLNNFEATLNGILGNLLADIFGGGGGGALEDLNNIIQQFAGLSSAMQFPLLQKYAQLTGVFNRAGSRSQDKRTKEEGCSTERVYDTELGAIKGNAAGGGAGGGAGSGGGLNNWTGLNFGGASSPTSGGIINLPCAGSLQTVLPWAKGNINGGDFDPDNFNPDDWLGTFGYKGLEIVPRDYDGPTFPINWQNIVFEPVGFGAVVIPRSLPSGDPDQAANFNLGIPNVAVVYNPGSNYYFGNPLEPGNNFPSVYIPGYNGTPVPVLDRATGEVVAVQTNPNSWNAERPQPTATVIPDRNPVGILSDDPGFEVTLAAVFVQNTGFSYKNPKFRVIDKDTGRENGAVKPVIQEGRIVELEVVDPGSNFKRIPEIRMEDPNGDPGFGLDAKPIMAVQPRPDAPTEAAVDLVYCPAKNQFNFTFF